MATGVGLEIVATDDRAALERYLDGRLLYALDTGDPDDADDDDPDDDDGEVEEV